MQITIEFQLLSKCTYSSYIISCSDRGLPVQILSVQKFAYYIIVELVRGKNTNTIVNVGEKNYNSMQIRSRILQVT